MNELVETGLFGKGLIMIDSPELVRRYNDCLADMGLQKTALDTFNIDAVGWSPEIAAERDNSHYLSHGEANPLAIILTPDQTRCPIYFPYHSYDWQLMQQVYDQNRPQLAELTKSEGVWADIDQDVDLYVDPGDLCMVSEIVVKFLTPSRVMEKAAHQKQLVQQFLSGSNIADRKEREVLKALEESNSDIGDMRFKSVVVPHMIFTDVRSFYTRSFGGIFVLRDLPVSGEQIVARDPSLNWSGGAYRGVSDPGILPLLEEEGVIQADLSWWERHIERLEILRDGYLMEVLDETHPDVDYCSLNSARQKGVISSVKERLPEEYIELDRLVHRVRAGELGSVPPLVKHHLYHPNSDLPASSVEVLWHLLTIIGGGHHVVRFYRHDKDEFFQAYKTWGTPRRKWAEKMISLYYEYRMMKR